MIFPATFFSPGFMILDMNIGLGVLPHGLMVYVSVAGKRGAKGTIAMLLPHCTVLNGPLN